MGNDSYVSSKGKSTDHAIPVTSPAKKEFEDHLVNDSRMEALLLLQKEGLTKEL